MRYSHIAAEFISLDAAERAAIHLKHHCPGVKNIVIHHKNAITPPEEYSIENDRRMNLIGSGVIEYNISQAPLLPAFLLLNTKERHFPSENLPEHCYATHTACSIECTPAAETSVSSILHAMGGIRVRVRRS